MSTTEGRPSQQGDEPKKSPKQNSEGVSLLLPEACARCGHTGMLIQPEGRVAQAQVCECSKHCPRCRDSRHIFSKDDYGREVVRPCICGVRRMRMRLFNGAGIPGKFSDARLTNDFKDKQNQEAFDILRLMAREYQRGQKGLLLMGPAGVGKSWLVSAFIHSLIFEHGVPTLFRDFFHLLAELRSGYSMDRPESELINPLVSIEVLVIDELGKGRNTPWEQNILDVIISQRYNDGRTTIFTSNYTTDRKTTLVERLRPRDAQPGEGDVEIRDTLPDRVGPRIFSRFHEMCDMITMTGPDRRNPDWMNSTPQVRRA